MFTPQDILGLVIILAVLIFVHESGHFLVAKAFGVRVLVFSLGFGKRLFGFKKGDTDYRISLIPLGGYVRMAGDIPEENQPGNPDEFLSKPKWQRLLILLAGPFMNLVTAVVIVTLVNMAGQEVIVFEPVIGGVTAKGPADLAGLKIGDRITRVNGEKIEEFDDLRLQISTNAGERLHIEYLRNGETRETSLVPNRVKEEFGSVGKAEIAPMIEPVVGGVTKDSPAAKAGIQKGDRIVSANGTPINSLFDVVPVADAAKLKPIAFGIVRGNQRLTINVPADPTDKQRTYRGIEPKTEFRQLAFGPAVRDALKQTQKMAKLIFTGLNRLVRGKSRMGDWAGPVGIARIAGEMFNLGIQPFVMLMAMISVNLAILNLLPIPVLDGGHIMIILVEAVARRDLSIATKERVQQIGFFFIAALMLLVIYSDLVTHVFKRLTG
jgi:regulator of sigma E protease